MSHKRRMDHASSSSKDNSSDEPGSGSSDTFGALTSNESNSPPAKRLLFQPSVVLEPVTCPPSLVDEQLNAVVTELVSQLVHDAEQPDKSTTRTGLDEASSSSPSSSSSSLSVLDESMSSPTASSGASLSNDSDLVEASTSRGTRSLLRDRSLSASKKSVNFTGVTVYYFARNQGFTCVPSQGGSTLGMDMNHCDQQNFTLDDHQEEKRRVHRQILMRRKRYTRLCQKQQQRQTATSLAAAASASHNGNASDSDEDSMDNISDISDTELEMDSWYFLQPVPMKQRRVLLRESGVNKIDSGEKEDCRNIRLSREFCGCECRLYCDPETCQCSLAGIKCQVDRPSFPCGCSRDACGNLNGRIEFNPLRVRTHLIHTIMRLGLEKKEETQVSFSSSSPHK